MKATHYIQVSFPDADTAPGYLPCPRRPTKAQARARAAKMGEGVTAFAICYPCPICQGEIAAICPVCDERGWVKDLIDDEPEKK